ncbi:MAG: alpha/beta hydrolase [Candidatus Latescibacterota bacterium]
MNLPGARALWIEPFEKHTFEVNGKRVSVVCPQCPSEGRHWAWKGEFLDAFPGTELALLAKGLHIVHMEYPDRFGCPDAVRKWSELYRLLTNEYGFARKPALIGLSRGGLYCYQWAIANPEKVACIYGDAPVCDMRSWPGGKGEGCGDPGEWEKVRTVFGFSSESEAMRYGGNPVDNLAPLAENHIPILHVYGDADDVVPWKENTGVLAERYRQLGGNIALMGKPDCGHHPHGLSDPAPVVDFIMEHTVSNESMQATPVSRLIPTINRSTKEEDR